VPGLRVAECRPLAVKGGTLEVSHRQCFQKSTEEEYHVQSDLSYSPLSELQVLSQSILGRLETRHSQNPHDRESVSDQKLLPVHQGTLDVRGDCRGLGTPEEKGG